jgi:hypothetical protein
MSLSIDKKIERLQKRIEKNKKPNDIKQDNSNLSSRYKEKPNSSLLNIDIVDLT